MNGWHWEQRGFPHPQPYCSLNYITTLFYKLPCKHETRAQCWSSVPNIAVLAKRWTGVVHMSRPCWHVIQGHLCNTLFTSVAWRTVSGATQPREHTDLDPFFFWCCTSVNITRFQHRSSYGSKSYAHCNILLYFTHLHMIQYPLDAKAGSDDEARFGQRRWWWNNIAPALVQPLMFVRYAMHWAGDGSLFPYTGRIPAQCFLCFLKQNYAYFNFIICMFFLLIYVM